MKKDKENNKLYFANGADKPVIINCDIGEKAPKPIFISKHRGRILNKKALKILYRFFIKNK